MENSRSPKVISGKYIQVVFGYSGIQIYNERTYVQNTYHYIPKGKEKGKSSKGRKTLAHRKNKQKGEKKQKGKRVSL
jgi:hypothetical protein